MIIMTINGNIIMVIKTNVINGNNELVSGIKSCSN